MLSNDGKWTIYDVIIEGVSLVNNYRSQFNNILMKSSFEELIQKIKDKKGKEEI
jgi:phospholipid transport system substrate-binding protein